MFKKKEKKKAFISGGVAGQARRNGINRQKSGLIIERDDKRMNSAEAYEMFYAVVPCRAPAVAKTPNFAISFFEMQLQ